MATHQQNSAQSSISKKPYTKPTLNQHGVVEEVTLAASGGGTITHG